MSHVLTAIILGEKENKYFSGGVVKFYASSSKELALREGETKCRER